MVPQELHTPCNTMWSVWCAAYPSNISRVLMCGNYLVRARLASPAIDCPDILRDPQSVPRWHNRCAKLARREENASMLDADTAVEAQDFGSKPP